MEPLPRRRADLQLPRRGWHEGGDILHQELFDVSRPCWVLLPMCSRFQLERRRAVLRRRNLLVRDRAISVCGLTDHARKANWRRGCSTRLKPSRSRRSDLRRQRHCWLPRRGRSDRRRRRSAAASIYAAGDRHRARNRLDRQPAGERLRHRCARAVMISSGSSTTSIATIESFWLARRSWIAHLASSSARTGAEAAADAASAAASRDRGVTTRSSSGSTSSAGQFKLRSIPFARPTGRGRGRDQTLRRSTASRGRPRHPRIP